MHTYTHTNTNTHTDPQHTLLSSKTDDPNGFLRIEKKKVKIIRFNFLPVLESFYSVK